MGDTARGLYSKFAVTRTDGKSEPGQKHHGCQYFVLDLDHDRHARAALVAYGRSCRGEYPLLAEDIRGLLFNCAFGETAMADVRKLTASPPSYFAKIGTPSCSKWGKSEIEWIALAYVQALANDGDTWKRLTREQTRKLLTDEQIRPVRGLLTDDYFAHWFELVSNQITDSESAFGVGGFWGKDRWTMWDEKKP